MRIIRIFQTCFGRFYKANNSSSAPFNTKKVLYDFTKDKEKA